MANGRVNIILFEFSTCTAACLWTGKCRLKVEFMGAGKSPEE
jgi:cytochrome oxidase Cu insertion factor (SCO1/SenC/PrrC family)